MLSRKRGSIGEADRKEEEIVKKKNRFFVNLHRGGGRSGGWDDRKRVNKTTTGVYMDVIRRTSLWEKNLQVRKVAGIDLGSQQD